MGNRSWTAVEIRQLAARFPEEGPAQLAIALDRSEDSISGQARRLGLRSTHRHRRQGQTRAESSRSVNPRFFDTPTPAGAYVLGLVWAGGSVKTHPRQVLRIRLPVGRADLLPAILGIMRSRHSIQRGRRRHLVELGNSRLVHSLLTRHGSPPDKANPDPPPPPLPTALVPHFARGLLDGAGRLGEKGITWSGPPRLITALQHEIQAATGLPDPATKRKGKRLTIGWSAPEHVQILNRWLPPPPRV